MITVGEAQKRLSDNFRFFNAKMVSIQNAYDRILAEDITAKFDVPAFNNSAMDGYAFSFENWDGAALNLVGESAAGAPFNGGLKAGEAVRIFTGAPIPKGADTVEMQEKAKVENGQLFLEKEKIQKGNHIRKIASQNKTGDVVANVGEKVTAGMAGFLAGMGVSEVPVFEMPKVHVIITGNEIVKPGEELNEGMIFESNSYALAAAFQKFGIVPEIVYCKDELNAISRAIGDRLMECDVLCITGGVSVGDYDYVIPALETNGVETVFHRVAQKPAKPLFLGKKENKIIFGLPGNPASVLTSFYVYIQAYLRAGTRQQNIWNTIELKCKNEFKRKAGLRQFVKAKQEGMKVEILDGQESYRMDGFARANCLIEIAEEIDLIMKDQVVPVIVF